MIEPVVPGPRDGVVKGGTAGAMIRLNTRVEGRCSDFHSTSDNVQEYCKIGVYTQMTRGQHFDAASEKDWTVFLVLSIGRHV